LGDLEGTTRGKFWNKNEGTNRTDREHEEEGRRGGGDEKRANKGMRRDREWNGTMDDCGTWQM
jgi:hypothetical protein